MIYFRKQKNIIFVLVLMLLLSSGCGKKVSKYEAADTAMGTVVLQAVYGTQDRTPEILSQVKNLETELLSKREAESEIGRINRLAGEDSIPVSGELALLLQEIREVSERSNGALDVTVSPAVMLWNIDNCALGTEEFVLPGEAQIKEAVSHIGYEKVRIEADSIRLPEGMSLDLGAVGKGIACDAIVEFLSEDETVEGAVISVGGSILTYGSKPDGAPWVIGIQNPRMEEGGNRNIGSLSLDGNWFVSTSGDYERYVMQDGKRYHHILNPRTGYPAESGLISVTVLSKSGWLSDALSTACFVLGKEEGMALAQEYGAYILVVDDNGEIECSQGMEAFFKP